MTVTVASSKHNAGECLVAISGTLAEVNTELSIGAVALSYRWKGHKRDILAFGGTSAAAMLIYKVDKGSGTP